MTCLDRSEKNSLGTICRRLTFGAGKKIITSLLIGILMAPGAWAAGESGTSGKLLNDAIQGAGDTFTQLYRVLWKENSLDSQLRAAINRAVDNEIKGELVPGVYFFSKSQNKAVENIQNGVIYQFNPDYETFLGILQKSFSDDYAKQLVDFYKTEVAYMVGRTQNPISRGLILAESSRLLKDDAEALKERINLSLNEKFPGLMLAKDGALLVIGLTTAAFSGTLATIAVNQLGLGGGALAGAAGSAIKGGLNIAGLVMAGYAVYDFAKTAKDAPDELKKTVEYHNNTYFFQEAPEKLWAALAGAVTEGFKSAEQELQAVQANAEKIASDPEVQRLMKELPNEKKSEFCQKLATVTMRLENPWDDPRFIKDFGNVILKTDVKQLDTLLDIIKRNRTVAAEWFTLAEPEEILQMFTDLQPGTWEKFAPTEESLNALRWVSKNLSTSAQSRTIDLDPADIIWLMTEFHEKYLTQLFDIQHSAMEIKGEIERMKKISDKDKRIPWPSESESTIRWILGFVEKGVEWIFEHWKYAAIIAALLFALPLLLPTVAGSVLPLILSTLLMIVKLPVKLVKGINSKKQKS